MLLISVEKIRKKLKSHQKLPFILCLFILYTDVVFANTVGSSLDNFNPTSSGLDYVTVRSSKVLDAGHFSLGLFVDHAVNTIPYFQDQQNTKSDNSKAYNDGTTSMNLNIGVGITNDWEIGLNLPIVAAQQVSDQDSYHGQFAKTGVMAISLSTKYNLWHNSSSGLAVVGTLDANDIKNNPFDGLNSGPSFSAVMVADTKISSFTFAGNLGYKFKSTGEAAKTKDSTDTPVQPMQNEIIGSTAVQYSIPNTKMDLVWEVYGEKPQNNDVTNQSSRVSSVMETIGGIKYHFENNLIAHAGIGTELMHSINTPNYRAYAGVYWIIGSKEEKVVKKEEVKTALPPPVPPLAREPDEKIIVQDVLFAFDKSTISHPAAKKNLKKLGDSLNKKPLELLVIDGHTCSIGTAEYNMKLSRQRANAIKNWIVKEYHIPASKIMINAYGLTRPLATNKTPEGRKMNRRTEFKIYYQK